MGVNKVVINKPEGEETIIDLTGVSVTPDSLKKGVTAFDAAGELIIGTMEAGGSSGGGDDELRTTTLDISTVSEPPDFMDCGLIDVIYPTIEDGKLTYQGEIAFWEGHITLENVVVNQAIVIHYYYDSIFPAHEAINEGDVENATVLMRPAAEFTVIKINEPDVPASVTIRFIDDSGAGN